MGHRTQAAENQQREDSPEMRQAMPGWTSTPTVHSSNTEPLGLTTIDAFPLERKRQGIRMKTQE